MKKRFFKSFVLVVLLSLLLPYASYANTNAEASFTISIDEKNVATSDNKYVYVFDAPTNFGELVGASFSGSGVEDKPPVAITYDETSHKLRAEFILLAGKKQVVKGYKDSLKGKFSQKGAYAVCRHMDGVRWQVNGITPEDKYVVDYYDYSKTSEGARPYSFYYGNITVQGKFTPNFNQHVSYWLGEDGTVYDASQINKDVKVKVLQEDISFPDGLPVSNIQYEKDKTYFNFKAVRYGEVDTGEFERNKDAKTTPPAECHWYRFDVFYNYTAETNVVQFINGKLTVRYKTSDLPKLVATLKAEPAKVKFENKDIAVKVTLNAKLINVKQPGVVKNYIVFLRTKDHRQNLKPEGYEVGGSQLEITVSDTFTIPASKLDGVTDFTEYFVGRAIAYVTNGDKDYRSDLVEATTYVYKQLPVEEVPLNNAVAIITGASKVKLGSYTSFMGHESYSTNEDGLITGYAWAIPDAVEQPETHNMRPDMSSILTWYNTLGMKNVYLYVEDNYGSRGMDFSRIEVIEPTIEATIGVGGTRKENRKLTINLHTDSPYYYPQIESKTKWSVKSLDGSLDSYIRHEPSLNGKQGFELLFKKAGEYLITAQVENTAGYKYEANYVIEIAEDEKPVAEFEFQQKVYRDPKNNNLATFELYDASYSYDGDYIAGRHWYVIFDANNDGRFTETPVLFNTGNNTHVIYQTSHVGKYKFILEAIEAFGEATIEQYVTEEERRKTKTDEG